MTEPDPSIDEFNFDRFTINLMVAAAAFPLIIIVAAYGTTGFELLIAAAVYLLPTITALRRRHRNTAAIVALNLLAGWTLVGWVGAFVWSYTR